MNIDPKWHHHAIHCHPAYGPTFGYSCCDIYIGTDSNTNTRSHSNLGHSFKHPKYASGTNEAQSFLSGSCHFQLSEIEVYQKE